MAVLTQNLMGDKKATDTEENDQGTSLVTK